MKKWTPEEEIFVKLNWNRMNINQLTEALNANFKTSRTKYSVDNKIDKMNLPRKRDYFRNCSDNDNSKLEIEGRQKTLELNEIKNLIKVNNNLKIKVKEERGSRILGGPIVQRTDELVVLQIGKYMESFKYVEFYTRRAVIV